MHVYTLWTCAYTSMCRYMHMYMCMYRGLAPMTKNELNQVLIGFPLLGSPKQAIGLLLFREPLFSTPPAHNLEVRTRREAPQHPLNPSGSIWHYRLWNSAFEIGPVISQNLWFPGPGAARAERESARAERESGVSGGTLRAKRTWRVGGDIHVTTCSF